MKFLIKNPILSFVVGVLILVSCNKNDTPTPVPPEPKPGAKETLLFKLKSSSVLEFKKIEGEAFKNIAQEEIADFFGKRTEFVIPKEIQISDESLSIMKPHGIVENYPIKWQDEELFLSPDSDDTWQYCGKLSGKDRFLLNIGFFIRLSEKEQRTLYITGQGYSLTTHDGIVKDPDDTVIWLKLEVIMEK